MEYDRRNHNSLSKAIINVQNEQAIKGMVVNDEAQKSSVQEHKRPIKRQLP